jgi:hypothetical protein
MIETSDIFEMLCLLVALKQQLTKAYPNAHIRVCEPGLVFVNYVCSSAHLKYR